MITLIQGVPGCGKTHEIVESVASGDLVVTATRVTKLDVEERLRCKRLDVPVRTCDSVLINGPPANITGSVYFDEALMVYAGDIVALSVVVNHLPMRLFGDLRQIPYINRTNLPCVKHLIKDLLLPGNIDYRNVSYRIPRDIAARIYDVHEGGVFTTNEIIKSTFVVQISTFADVPVEQDVLYLTMKQSDKQVLISNGFPNVHTVHEKQGCAVQLLKFLWCGCRQKNRNVYTRIKNMHLLLSPGTLNCSGISPLNHLFKLTR